MRHKRASVLLVSLCVGVLLIECGKAPNSGENAASIQAVEDTRKEDVNRESVSQGEEETEQGVRRLTSALDWTPSTNHTGFYVAREEGYFKDTGLEVEIVQPPKNRAEILVTSGKAQFAVSFQGSLASVFSGDNPLPVTAVTGVIQCNASGIASRRGKGMDRPRRLEEKKYATWDLPVEKMTTEDVMEADGGDFGKVELIPSTVTDEVTTLRTKFMDIIQISYAWAGVKTELESLETDCLAFADSDSVSDFYTPVTIANNIFLVEEPEIARALLDAISRRYEFVTEHPQEAGGILCRAAPELDLELVKTSQEYLVNKYQTDAPKWGYADQKHQDAYYAWLSEKSLVEVPIEVGTGSPNGCLP